MLSRVADSMFWMSRYIERAENVARFIDVNWHLILDSSIREESQWLALVNTTGDLEVFEKREGAATRESVIQFLTFDTENANSILSCVRAARENARCIRDAISQEMWEQINMFYLMLNDSASGNKALVNPYDFFNEVKMASHLFVGINDTTMSHNEAWNFCRLGRYLERTDKTSRILDVKYYMLRAKLIENPSPSDDIQWAAMLKSASALEMYRKTHRQIQPDRVVEFLLLDREFPRAVLYCLNSASEALHQITGTVIGTHDCSAERRIGMLRSEVAYADVQEVLDKGLHEYVDALQTKLNTIDDAIYDTFFSMKPSPASQSQSQSQGTQTQSQSQTLAIAAK